MNESPNQAVLGLCPTCEPTDCANTKPPSGRRLFRDSIQAHFDANPCTLRCIRLGDTFRGSSHHSCDLCFLPMDSYKKLCDSTPNAHGSCSCSVWSACRQHRRKRLGHTGIRQKTHTLQE